MTITPEQLAGWKALADKATPPPLEISRYDHGGARVFAEGKTKLVADYCHEGDREFYLAARTAVPALVAEVERLQGDVVTLKRYMMTTGALRSHEYDCDVCGDEDGDPQRAECAEGQRLRERVADAFDAAIKV